MSIMAQGVTHLQPGHGRLHSPRAERKFWRGLHWTHGSWPGAPPRMYGAHALSGAGSVDTATTLLLRISRAINLIIESIRFPHHAREWCATTGIGDPPADQASRG